MTGLKRYSVFAFDHLLIYWLAFLYINIIIIISVAIIILKIINNNILYILFYWFYLGYVLKNKINLIMSLYHLEMFKICFKMVDLNPFTFYIVNNYYFHSFLITSSFK